MPESPQRERNQAAAGNNQRHRSVQSELARRTGEGGQRGYGSKQHPSLSSAHPMSSSLSKYTVCAELLVNRSPIGLSYAALQEHETLSRVGTTRHPAHTVLVNTCTRFLGSDTVSGQRPVS